MNDKLIEVRDLGNPIAGYYYKISDKSYVGVEIDFNGRNYLVNRDGDEFVAYEFIDRSFQSETALVRKILDDSLLQDLLERTKEFGEDDYWWEDSEYVESPVLKTLPDYY